MKRMFYGRQWAMAAACLLAVASSLFASEVPREITYVANLENGTQPKVRYTGREWVINPEGFLSGRGPGHKVAMIPPPGAGDFRVEAKLVLPMKGRRSAIAVGYDSRIVLVSGGNTVSLEGRFFRAGEKPVEVSTATVPPTGERTLVIDRVDGKVSVSVDGQVAYSGACDSGPLPLLGVDPGDGTVQLIAMSAQGHLPEGGEKEFGNAFGLQMRPVPKTAQEVFAPVIVHEGPTNECSLIARRDGILELYHATKPASDSISVMRSKDGGLTWGPSEIAFPLPGKIYYAVMAAEARDGTVHIVFHVAAEGPGGYRGRLYHVYHTKSLPDGKGWEEPKLVIPGYVGSIRGFIELASGRLLLSVGLANPDRMEAPKSGVDFGWNDIVTYTSDDKGGVWTRSPDVLKIPLAGENNTRYGAIEPALVQLESGQVWMLIRSRDGKFWQSFSEDGIRWSPPEVSAFITSDSPASFIKLKDKRIVLLVNACQNWTNPRSYAMGGREVLQAAISEDDAKTWRGFRDVLHETVGPSGGDRGTSYASGAATKDGKICFFGGQGEGKRAIVLFDPAWLTEKQVRDEVKAGAVSWTQYGDDGLQAEMVDDNRVVAIPLKSSGLCGASWNFPAMKQGEISLRLLMPKEASAMALGLSDHFARVDDLKATENSIFRIPVDPKSGFTAGEWYDVKVRWTEKEAELFIGDRLAQTIPAAKPAEFGLNYLRVEARSAVDQGEIKLANLQATQK